MDSLSTLWFLEQYILSSRNQPGGDEHVGGKGIAREGQGRRARFVHMYNVNMYIILLKKCI